MKALKQKIISALIISLVLVQGCQTKQESLLNYLNKTSDKEEFIQVNNLKINFPESEDEFLTKMGLYDYDTLTTDPDEFFRWDDVEKFVMTPYEHTHWKVATTEVDGKYIPLIIKWSDMTLIDTEATRVSTWSQVDPNFDTLHYYLYFIDKSTLLVNGTGTKTNLKIKYLGEKGIKGEDGYKFDNYLIDLYEMPAIYIYANSITDY